MILVNYKTYKESSGENAINLTNIISKLSHEYGLEIIACPNFLDLKDVTRIYSSSVWAQQSDFFERGRATGFIPPELLKESGATGVILNHSEHKLSFEDLTKDVERIKNLELKVLIFADSLDEAVKVSSLSPDWIGYEPPELVASKDTSVAKAKPEIIEQVVKAIPNLPILVGAGVKNQEDVRVSLKLGAKAVGVASGVILAEDQEKALRDLMEGFRNM